MSAAYDHPQVLPLCVSFHSWTQADGAVSSLDASHTPPCDPGPDRLPAELSSPATLWPKSSISWVSVARMAPTHRET